MTRERSMPLKEKFNVTYNSPRNERHDSLCRATEETIDFSQETGAGVRGALKPQPLLGFLWERQSRAEFKIG